MGEFRFGVQGLGCMVSGLGFWMFGVWDIVWFSFRFSGLGS